MFILALRIYLLFIALNELLKPTEGAITDPFNIQLCNQLENLIISIPPAEPKLSPNEFEQANDQITKIELSNYMAGSKEDCEIAINLAWVAANKNEYTRRMLKTLMAHPNFRISLDASELHRVKPDGFTSTEAIYGVNLFIIYIDPNAPNFSRMFIHECTHLLLNYIISEMVYDVFPMIIGSRDLNEIFARTNSNMTFNTLKNKWDENFKKVLENYAHKINKKAIGKQNELILKEILHSMESESSEINIFFIEQAHKSDSYKVGTKIPARSFVNHPNVDKFGDLKIVRRIERPQTSLVEVHLQGKNNFEAYVINWLRYLQIHSKKYNRNEQHEEYITHAVQEASYPLLENIYPELIKTLINYSTELLSKHPHDVTDRQSDNPKLYLTSYRLRPSWVYESEGAFIAIKRKMLALIENRNENIDEIDIAIITLLNKLTEDTLKTSKEHPTLDMTTDSLYLGEMYFLKKDYKNAFRYFQKADTLFRKIKQGKGSVFDQISGSLQRYNTAENKLNRTVIACKK